MEKLGTQTITTENAIIKLDKQGIVHLSFQNYAYVNLDESKEILSARKRLLPNTKQFLLVDLTNDPVPNKESKQFANSDDLINITKAMALITKGNISRIVGNFFFQMKETSYPTRLFTNKKDAIDWLLSQ
jgi:hypothetical protein|tara:strand:- start:250 stop:639 length:390 start_codon:yes stop_codon:yes gene_type:complete